MNEKFKGPECNTGILQLSYSKDSEYLVIYEMTSAMMLMEVLARKLKLSELACCSRVDR